MKFKCGLSRADLERLKEWHRWFAWHPVSVGDGDCRWLEYVYRRYHYVDIANYKLRLGVVRYKAIRS